MANSAIWNLPARAPTLTDRMVADSSAATPTSYSTLQQLVTLTYNNCPFTQGSVIFVGASNNLSENNSIFYWDDANTTLRIGQTLSINGTVANSLVTGQNNVIQDESNTVIHGQGNIVQDGFRNFAQGSSNTLDTCSDSAVIGSTSVDLTNASNSGAIGSTTCTNTGFDNSVFIGASSANSNANYGVLMGQGVDQNSSHANVLMWGDSQVGTFNSVASDAWHVRVQHMYFTNGASVTSDSDSFLAIDVDDKYVKLAGGSTANRTALFPSEKALFYDTTIGEYYYGNGTSWVPLSSGTGTSGTHNTDWTGIWAADQTGNIKYTLDGNVVTLTIPVIVAVPNASAMVTNVTALPVALRPAAITGVTLRAFDDSQAIWGWASLDTAGVITIGVGPAGEAFTNGSGSAGWSSFNLTYNL